MKLFLVRHGQSRGNVKAGFISGRTDTEGLTDKGKIQVIRTAYELRNEAITSVLVSPVVRAQETARILHHYFPQATFTTLDWLSELHHGVMEGKYWWEVIHKIPSHWRNSREDYESPYPGGGESMKDLFTRVSFGLGTYLSQHSKGATVIVSHQAPITAMRYLMAHGGPETLHTKSAIQTFTKYIHEVKLPNGGFVKTEFKNGVYGPVSEVSSFAPVEERKGNVEFYAKGVLDVDKVMGAKEKTASKNSVYRVKTKTKSLLKILSTDQAKSVQKHIKVYSYLQKVGLSVPRILFHDSSHAFYKQDVLIQDFAEGMVQEQCLRCHPEKVVPTLKTIYKEISNVHAIPTTDVSDFWIPPGESVFHPWKPFMLFNINMTLHMLQELVENKKTQKKIADALISLKNYIRGGTYALVPIHGDLAPGNIIIRHVKGSCVLSRLIDFEWTRVGDALWDLAYYWGWLERDNSLVAQKWHALVARHLTQDQKEVLSWYRILFHAWTVRDMFEYDKSSLRKDRGEASKKILDRIDAMHSV